MMTPERWQKVKQIFQAAIECAPGERSAFLSRACGADELLRKEVESLIASHEKDDSFMDSPAYEAAGVMLASDQEFKAGQRIGHYEILSTLGKGGMGEVYLARDPRLDRKVALKILPAEVAGDRQRMSRFVQEAKAAAALNHPNIAHIYEIGETDGVNFIAMEYVEGATLSEKIHLGRTPLKKLLDYLAQVAEGLSKAHAARIVHRDLKPDNIMVTRDGYAKILDFGLAKLLQVQDSDANPEQLSKAATARFPASGHSAPGMVLGTVGYMSPEQAQGQTHEIDHRSDIFSFGCVLYEATTKQKAFAGTDVLDSLHKIVHAPTPQISAANPDAPSDLQRIIRRCLAKDRDERYQTIKELAIELRELRRTMEESEIDAMPDGIETQSGKLSVGQAVGAAPDTIVASRSTRASSAEFIVSEIKRHKRGALVALGVGALLFAGVAVALYKLIGRNRQASLGSFQTMKIGRLTSIGKAKDAAISPDGKYVVYTLDDAGQQSLWLRHVATGSDKEIAGPAELHYRGLVFSNNGDYIYFIGAGKNKESDGLYRVTVLGGDLRKLSGNVGSSVSNITMVTSLALSPDDRRVAFALRPDTHGESALIFMNTDGTGEHKLLTRRLPERTGEPGWSPDGKTIVCSVANISAGYSFTLIAVNSDDGKERQLSSQRWWSVGHIAWLRDGGGFVMTGADQPFGLTQVWYISYPDGKARRVTNDLNYYSNVSLTANSGALVAVQSNRQLNVSIAPEGDASRARQIVSGDASISHASWTPDNRIVYDSMAGGKRAIWIMDADGKNQEQLIADADVSQFPVVSPDGRDIVFQVYRDGAFNIWRIQIDGGNPRQLTDDKGNFPVITADGKWVVYFVLTANGGQIRRVPIEGGAPVPVTDEKVNAITPHISPDGQLIACNYSSAEHPPTRPGAIFSTAIIPFGGGEPIKIFDLLGGPEGYYNWTTDSRALTYIVTRGDVSNIWGQPINGDQPVQLTNFTSEQIFSYDWSRDGKQLLCLRGTTSSDVVILSDFQ